MREKYYFGLAAGCVGLSTDSSFSVIHNLNHYNYCNFSECGYYKTANAIILLEIHNSHKTIRGFSSVALVKMYLNQTTLNINCIEAGEGAVPPRKIHKAKQYRMKVKDCIKVRKKSSSMHEQTTSQVLEEFT